MRKAFDKQGHKNYASIKKQNMNNYQIYEQT